MIHFLSSRLSDDLVDEVCKRVHRLGTEDLVDSLRLPRIERCVLDDPKFRLGRESADASIRSFEIHDHQMSCMFSEKEPTMLCYKESTGYEILMECQHDSVLRYYEKGRDYEINKSYRGARPWRGSEARRLLNFMGTPSDLPDLIPDDDSDSDFVYVPPVFSTNHYVIANFGGIGHSSESSESSEIFELSDERRIEVFDAALVASKVYNEFPWEMSRV